MLRSFARGRRRVLAVLGSVSIVVALAVALTGPSVVVGQATRTWVSGVGDDANPCSRTAPCKTFAGAISKTAAGGEINCIDPGGFGAVTITKSMTIKCQYTEAGVLASGTNAIVINAAATDKVTLRGMDVTGVGTGAPTSLSGVKILSALEVEIIDSEIDRFQAGVVLASTAANVTTLVMKNDHVHNNNLGLIIGPGNNSNQAVATLEDNLFADNSCNIIASAFGTNASTPTAVQCGAATSASGINNKATISAFNNAFVNASNASVVARGTNGLLRLGNNDITGSSQGVVLLDAGVFRSFSDNFIDGNGSTAPPTNTSPKT